MTAPRGMDPRLPPIDREGEIAMPKYNILILGASYGSLLASKMMFGGHNMTVVCLPAEADLINAEGFRVRMPIRGSSVPIEIDSRKLPGKVTAVGPGDANPKDFDLIGLAMQEPQYGSNGVRELLDAVAKSRVPCMSIMNMPPLPYMKRIPGLGVEALKPAYTNPAVWDNFDPGTLTLCSPDPQDASGLALALDPDLVTRGDAASALCIMPRIVHLPPSRSLMCSALRPKEAAH
jgi:hypothetical protein